MSSTLTDERIPFLHDTTDEITPFVSPSPDVEDIKHSSATAVPKQRLVSLDVFRGLTVAVRKKKHLNFSNCYMLFMVCLFNLMFCYGLRLRGCLFKLICVLMTNLCDLCLYFISPNFPAYFVTMGLYKVII